MADQCGYGYIRSQKKWNLAWLAAYILLGLAIFFCGYLLTRTRANIFTVVAMLMVLPAAKRVVALVVLMPRKGVGRERYEYMSRVAEGGILLTDYVFTSSERIMHLDFVLIRDGKVLAVLPPSRQDVEYMEKYLADGVHREAPEFDVVVFNTDEELARYVREMAKPAGRDETVSGKLREFLCSLAV